MITLLLILLPAVLGSLNFLLKGKMSNIWTLLVAILELSVTGFVLLNFNPAEGYQFVWDYWWIPTLGWAWSFGIDGLGMVMLLLTNIVVFLIALFNFDKNDERQHAKNALVLIMQAALNGVFTAADPILFYIFWELALIPVYFLSAMWGGQNRIKATLKFFIYTVAGSLFMLLALLIAINKGYYFNLLDGFPELMLGRTGEFWVFWGIFIAFAIKIPIFPLHSWQPDTYTESSTTGTMLLSGVMLKMGLFGLIKWLLPVAPHAALFYSKTIIIAAIVGVLYASIIAIKQNHIKKILAFSSMAHVGMIAAVFFTGSISGWQGGVFQMFTHGINVVALFLVADILMRQTGVADIRRMGGIASLQPTLAILFFILILSSVGLPLTDSFVGEFLMLGGLYTWQMWAMILAGTSVIFSAVYLFRLYQKTMFGTTSEYAVQMKQVSWNEYMVLGICCGLSLFLGIFPNALMQISNPVIADIVNQIQG